MYACIFQTKHGIFEEVCPPSSATGHLRDPPPPRYAIQTFGAPIALPIALGEPQDHSWGRRFALTLPVFDGLSFRVTDGARTRDLRSHNPMLCLLSYGHHAHPDSTSENARSKMRLTAAFRLSG